MMDCYLLCFLCIVAVHYSLCSFKHTIMAIGHIRIPSALLKLIQVQFNSSQPNSFTIANKTDAPTSDVGGKITTHILCSKDQQCHFLVSTQEDNKEWTVTSQGARRGGTTHELRIFNDFVNDLQLNWPLYVIPALPTRRSSMLCFPFRSWLW